MSNARWAEDLGAAMPICAVARTQPAHPSDELPIDPYGSESPAEFFAVCSETFFELPHLLRDEYPRVYAQLSAFYRQDPALRLPEIDWRTGTVTTSTRFGFGLAAPRHEPRLP
jgi:Mlc titration factor MtfA (ptsG expression regulator)